ncbi:MAG: hypothetical protein RIS35_3508, partial [Pseudomonadota bacterium]
MLRNERPIGPGTSDWRVSAWLLLPVFLIIGARYFLEILEGGQLWKTGDWLIHYGEGLVRRGLAGTLLMWAGSLGIPMRWALYVVQLGAYAVLFSVVAILFRARERSSAWLLVLFSPAFLVFPLQYPYGAFRKEILLFACWAWLCLRYARGRVTSIDLLVTVCLFGIAAFSHELAVCALPFFGLIASRCRATGLISRSQEKAYLA